jgi:hypothetical protein
MAPAPRVLALLNEWVTNGITPLTQLISGYWRQELWVIFFANEPKTPPPGGDRLTTTVIVFDAVTGALGEPRQFVDCQTGRYLTDGHLSPMWTDGPHIVTAPRNVYNLPHVCLQVSATDRFCIERRPSPYASGLRLYPWQGTSVAFDPVARLMFQIGSITAGMAFTALDIDTDVVTRLPDAPIPAWNATLLVNTSHVALVTASSNRGRRDDLVVALYDRVTARWHNRVLECLHTSGAHGAANGAFMYTLAHQGAHLYCLQHAHGELTVWRCWPSNSNRSKRWRRVAQLQLALDGAEPFVTAFRHSQGFIVFTNGTPGAAYEFDCDLHSWRTLPHAPQLHDLEPTRATFVTI